VTTLAHEPAQVLSLTVAAALGLDAEPLRAPPVELWPAEGRCLVAGRTLSLSRRESALLAVLVAAPDRIVPRGRLYELVWGERMPARRRDVDVYVRKLRLRLAEAAPGWSFIHTHRQFGYRFHPQQTRPGGAS
jgi:DNA-binding response OmpR family regulator